MVEDKLNCFSIKSSIYLILLGGEDVDNTITLTNWLVTSYGAKNILIFSAYSGNKNDIKYLERNIFALKTGQKDVSIQLVEEDPNNPNFVSQQIVQRKISKIAAMLILSNNYNNNQNDEFLIKEVRTKFPNTHVVLLSSVENINHVSFERYHSKNIANVSYLRWDQKRRLSSVINSLTEALDEVVDILVRNDKVIENRKVVKTAFSFLGLFYKIISEQLHFNCFFLIDFCRLLSSSVPSILKCNPIKAGVTVEPMTNKNPRRTIDLAPMFVVPGLLGSKCTYLQNTVKNLLNPAFILDAAYDTLSIDKLAICLGEVNIIYVTKIHGF